MLNLNHKKLEVWKMSISFVSMIYKATDQFPKSEIYGITNQLRRAAVSVPSNIAEGASRASLKDRKRFYEIARSSLVEIDTQLEISANLGFLKEKLVVQATELLKTMNSLFAMLSRLIEKTK